MKYRHGPPETPTTVTAGAEGSSAMVVRFADYARPAFVTNINAVDLYVKINADDAAADDYHFKVAANTTSVDLSCEGLVNVRTISLYGASGTPYDTVVIFGWEP